MCIIAYKPADKEIKEDIIRECFFRNPDGAGITYVENGRIVIQKGIKTADDLVKAVLPHMEKEMVIHCRVASRGMVVDDVNCHPFYIKARVDENGEPAFEYSVSHNGTLEWGHTAEKSDTHRFTELFLTPMFESHPHVLSWEWGRIALERTISFGTGLKGRLNKMVIMVNDLRPENKKVITYILNEFEGEWKGGIWYSNTSWDKNTRPVQDWRSEGFFGRGKIGAGVIKSPIRLQDEYRWYCEPDANGWFWSYTWDAWINHKTGTLMRELAIRQSPQYMRKEGYNPVEMGGRTSLTKGEVNQLILEVYEQMELGGIPPIDKCSNLSPAPSTYKDKDALAHLDSSEKSLICKKAYDIIIWGGASKRTVKAMDAEAKVKELRDWIKSLYEGQREEMEIDGMTEVELDMWIIKQIKAGELTTERLNHLWSFHEKKAANMVGAGQITGEN
jgi:hypothetical protein